MDAVPLAPSTPQASGTVVGPLRFIHHGIGARLRRVCLGRSAGTDQYRYLLALGLLAVAVSLFRPRRQWASPPSRVVRWCVTLLPAYVLMQAVPLPVWLVRASRQPEPRQLPLARIGSRVNLTSR